MLICQNAEAVRGQRQVGDPWSRTNATIPPLQLKHKL